MTIGKALRGLWAHGLDYVVWLLEKWNDEQHTRRSVAPAPHAYVDGQPLPRPARVPDVRCTHGHPLDQTCRECEPTVVTR